MWLILSMSIKETESVSYALELLILAPNPGCRLCEALQTTLYVAHEASFGQQEPLVDVTGR